jgi:hypothetical protein
MGDRRPTTQPVLPQVRGLLRDLFAQWNCGVDVRPKVLERLFDDATARGLTPRAQPGIFRELGALWASINNQPIALNRARPARFADRVHALALQIAS